MVSTPFDDTWVNFDVWVPPGRFFGYQLVTVNVAQTLRGMIYEAPDRTI